ncbi:hypothetical protein MJO28_002666 [Puccinia striiformis f. sp. tritici]|uniref:Uncharacterized protein n=1 Tax=Puccinia striiformis f. sp. tritici TaxID=168172 RepID=A0ACC0ESN2_9BASI|nr:hypothetical protein MJO28_002666 [Puccinia striiformis f. sp. tritici]
MPKSGTYWYDVSSTNAQCTLWALTEKSSVTLRCTSSASLQAAEVLKQQPCRWKAVVPLPSDHTCNKMLGVGCSANASRSTPGLSNGVKECGDKWTFNESNLLPTPLCSQATHKHSDDKPGEIAEKGHKKAQQDTPHPTGTNKKGRQVAISTHMLLNGQRGPPSLADMQKNLCNHP